MPWLTGVSNIINKAGDVLEKLDQSAAVALQSDAETGNSTSAAAQVPPEAYFGQPERDWSDWSTSRASTDSNFLCNVDPDTKSIAATNGTKYDAGHANISHTTNSTAIPRVGSTPNFSANKDSDLDSLTSDDKLFEFLNKPSKSSARSRTPSPFPQASNLQESVTDSVPRTAIEKPDEPGAPPATATVKNSVVSSLKLENKILKDELNAVSQERDDAIKRAKMAQEEMSFAKEETRLAHSELRNFMREKEEFAESSQVGCAGDEVSDWHDERESLRRTIAQMQQEVQAAADALERKEMECEKVDSALRDEKRAREAQAEQWKHLVSNEEMLREDADEDLRYSREQHAALEEEFLRAKNQLKSQEVEIKSLKQQLTINATMSAEEPSGEESEKRYRGLIEKLIRKQEQVGVLLSEKNSLVLKSEILERELLAAKAVDRSKKLSAATLEMNDENVHVNDGTSLAKVRRMYRSWDTINIRLGTFFRHHPRMRAVMYLYVAVLHLWAVYLLMIYNPEVHNAYYNPKMP